jgi:hypothetical protein
LNRKERKDHKEETSQVLPFEFFVFFAVKIFLELRDADGGAKRRFIWNPAVTR